MHITQEELTLQIEQAKSKVQVGGSYVHYKDASKTYKVLHIAVTESDDKPCVIYQAEYGTGVIFVRPLESWLEEIGLDDDTTVSRFALQG